ncbi:MAG TPA: O-antigen ligase family protein [Chlamydiales bacterium]|nr:O-antigen ligase family protein [Chlamydiales bacterium]
MMKKWASVLFALVIFFVPIEHKYDKPLRHFSLSVIPDGLTLPSGFDAKIYFYPSDIIAFILFLSLLFAFRIPARKIFMEKGTICLLIIVCCALLSIISSPLSNYFTVYTRLLQLLTPCFLFAFLSQITFSEKQIRNLFYWVVIAALLQSFIAITQYFTQEHLGLRLLSESRDAPAIFEVAGGKRWLLDRVFDTGSASSIIKRSAGTFPHSNVLGGFLMMSVILTYALIAKAQKKTILTLALLVQMFALFLTYSRSAVFGILLGTIVWFTFAFYHRHFYRYLAGAIVSCVAICSCLLFEQYLHRGGIVNYNETAKNSDQVRIVAQSTAIEMIKDHPVAGVGFQQFSKVAESYGNKTGTHNIYLFICSEMGMLALIAFLVFIWIVLRGAISSPFSSEKASLLAIFIAFLFIGGCDYYPITFQQGKLMFFMTAAMIISLRKQEQSKQFEGSYAH